MKLVLPNIKSVGDRVTAGKQLHYKLYYIHNKQVDRSRPFPKPNASREIGSLPLLPGEYMHYLEMINYSTDDKSTGTKGDITSTVENALTSIVGGSRPEVFNFLENNIGELFYLIVLEVDTGKMYLYGREFTPFALSSFERSAGKESRSSSLTFTNSAFDQPIEYIGSIETEPATEIAADASTLNLASGSEFVTSSANTAATTIDAFTGLTDADQGRNIEIVGGGGTHPSKISEVAGSIVLRSGEDWTGTAGNRIILRVLDSSTLVEMSRS